jgi:hypothetical protein
MVKILKNEGNTILYECDCGVKGKCMVKPVEGDAAIVVDVKCPLCLDAKRVVLTQYESDESGQKIKGDLNNMNLSWSPVISNKITDYLLKKDEEEEWE